jgi:hypothetical protein
MEKNIEEMRYEAADILIYLMKFCRETQINIIELTLKKLEKLQKNIQLDIMTPKMISQIMKHILT